ncbi:MAG: ATP-binding protein [Streptosporangiaceae bacterium]|nr:ATP-binding protein [Streptosporangiaceae bacterium]
MSGDPGPPAEAVRGSMPVLMQDFDDGSLYALRAAVAAHAAAAGLSSTRVYDVVAVTHELAANAVRHGAGHGQLRMWTDRQVLYCQVTDDGPRTPPHRAVKHKQTHAEPVPWPAERGHGLWVAGKVADQVSVDRGPAGTTATIAFTISPSSLPAQTQAPERASPAVAANPPRLRPDPGNRPESAGS